MANKSMNNPRDPVQERFSHLEAQVVYVSHNVNLLMSALTNKLGILGKFGGYNVEVRLEGRSRYKKET